MFENNMFGVGGNENQLSTLGTLLTKKKKPSKVSTQPTLLSGTPTSNIPQLSNQGSDAFVPSRDYMGAPSSPGPSGPSPEQVEAEAKAKAEAEAKAQAEAAAKNKAPAPPPERKYEIKYITADDIAALSQKYNMQLDDSWIGLPFAIGYVDENGNYVIEQERFNLAQQLHDLQNMGVPNTTDITQTQAFQELMDLTQQLNNPGNTEQDLENSMTWTERYLGMMPGEFSEMMNNMMTQANLGIGGQQGLSQQEMDAWNRQTGTMLQEQQSEAQMLIEALGASGRSVEGFKAADEIARGMADFRNQRFTEMLNTDFLRKQAEYESLAKRTEQLFNMGQITSQQYLDTLRQDRLSALQGYAQAISAYTAQNQTEIAAFTAHADVIYKSIMADLGINESMLNDSQQFYEMYMAPYYTELEKWSIQEEADAVRAAKNMNQGSMIIGGMVSGATIGASFGGPLAPLTAIIGGVIGGVVGFFTGGGSIICTELHRQGLMDEDTYRADELYGLAFQRANPKAYAGYIRLATPVVHLMRKSKLFTSLVKVFVDPWSREMAYMSGMRNKGSLFGRLIHRIGVLICEKAGKELSNVMA